MIWVFWFVYFLFYCGVLSSRVSLLTCALVLVHSLTVPPHLSHISLVSAALFPASLHLQLLPVMMSVPSLFVGSSVLFPR